MRRRRLLATAASAPAALGGCLSDDAPPVGLGRIAMTNVRPEPIRPRFVVEKSGTTVYDETHRLRGTADGPAGSVEIIEPWMGERVDYRVTVSIADGDLRERFSTADAEAFVSEWGDNNCFTLSITPDRDDLYFALGALESCPE